MIKKLLALIVLFFTSITRADLVDGSFENNDVYYGYGFIQGGIDTQWKTTAPDNLIEIWGQYMPTASYDGTRHAELNANYASALYQDVNGLGDNNSINWHFAHRGRYGTDVMKLSITDLGIDQAWGGGDDTVLFTQNYSADNLAWQTHFGTITSIGNLTRFSFEAISAVGGNTQGNFIDWCGFGPGVVIPCGGPVALVLLAGFITPRRRNI